MIQGFTCQKGFIRNDLRISTAFIRNDLRISTALEVVNDLRISTPLGSTCKDSYVMI